MDAVDVAELWSAPPRRIPWRNLTVLDNGGHYPMLEAPDRWTTAKLAALG